MRRSLVLLALLGLLAVPASACAVCFQAEENTRFAYYATTGVLLALPPLIVGGFTVWYARRARQLPGDDAA
jgi:hypothetical protein